MAKEMRQANGIGSKETKGALTRIRAAGHIPQHTQPIRAASRHPANTSPSVYLIFVPNAQPPGKPRRETTPHRGAGDAKLW